MALPHTVYRLRIDLSDVDRGVYENLDLRVAQHPSETLRYFLTRVFALAFHVSDGAVFSGAGLRDPDEPAVLVRDLTGRLTHWIDIGSPSAERLHKASKRADVVWVYTHKDPEHLVRGLRRATIHRREEIRLLALEPAFLDAVARDLVRNCALTLVRTEGTLFVTIGDETHTGKLVPYSLTEAG